MYKITYLKKRRKHNCLASQKLYSNNQNHAKNRFKIMPRSLKKDLNQCRLLRMAEENINKEKATFLI